MSLRMEDVLKPERPKRERKVKEPKEPKPTKQPRRWDASLRLYGPKDARTHARLIIGVEPAPNTPEAFYEEMIEESKVSKVANAQGWMTYFKIGFTPYRF